MVHLISGEKEKMPLHISTANVLFLTKLILAQKKIWRSKICRSKILQDIFFYRKIKISCRCWWKKGRGEMLAILTEVRILWLFDCLCPFDLAVIYSMSSKQESLLATSSRYWKENIPSDKGSGFFFRLLPSKNIDLSKSRRQIWQYLTVIYCFSCNLICNGLKICLCNEDFHLKYGVCF